MLEQLEQLEQLERPEVHEIETPGARSIAPKHAPKQSGRARRRQASFRAESVAVALAILTLVNLTIQLDRRAWDVRSDGYYGMRRVQQCELLGRAPDTLYLGSSRTLYGVDARLIDRVTQARTGRPALGCNAGMLGSTFEQDYYTLKRLIEDGATPKLVVETLWEWNLDSHAMRTADEARDHRAQVYTLADLGDAPALGAHFSGAQGVSDLASFLTAKAIPLYGDRAGLLRALCRAHTLGPCGVDTAALDKNTRAIYERSDRQGWVPDTDAPIAQLSTEQRQAARNGQWVYIRHQINDFTIGGSQAGYLRTLIALAEAHGARVALVAPPLHPIYYSLFDRPDAWPQIAAYWRALAAAQGVSFYDMSHAPGYGDADFCDPEHLSPAGARTFSTWLAERVVAPRLT